MDSFEYNKIAGAVLGTCLALLALNITAEGIFAPHHPDKPGFEVKVKLEAPAKPEIPAKPEAPAAGGAEANAGEPVGKLLASADIGRGQGAARLCATCHTFQKGGANGQGPNLYGVVGRARASVSGFAYSEPMKAKGGEWTVEDLNKFLTSPKDFVPGTKMNFQGFSKGGQRADVIAYLNSLADNPKPLPVAQQ
jgi:cytochrome c